MERSSPARLYCLLIGAVLIAAGRPGGARERPADCGHHLMMRR